MSVASESLRSVGRENLMNSGSRQLACTTQESRISVAEIGLVGNSRARAPFDILPDLLKTLIATFKRPRLLGRRSIQPSRCWSKVSMSALVNKLVPCAWLWGHPFVTSTKIRFLTPIPLSTCVHMGRTPPPCGRPHSIDMKYTQWRIPGGEYRHGPPPQNCTG